MIVDKELAKKINTLYIISKGRPQCRTAQTLEKLRYPGEWFIVCGTNDDKLEEYKQIWGEHILVFDWAEEIKKTDTMDNFGFEKMPSGAVPVRNATCDFARSRGELRHWQFDDDYTTFAYTDTQKGKNKVIKDGKKLFDLMYRIAKFGYDTNMANVGFTISTMEACPVNWQLYANRVFAAHNMPTDEKFERWTSRMNDDTMNAIDICRHGKKAMQFRFLQLSTTSTQQESGGLSDIYKAEGTVRKTAYIMLKAPSSAKLIISFGRYHHWVNWKNLVPKLLREDLKK